MKGIVHPSPTKLITALTCGTRMFSSSAIFFIISTSLTVNASICSCVNSIGAYFTEKYRSRKVANSLDKIKNALQKSELFIHLSKVHFDFCKHALSFTYLFFYKITLKVQ